MSEILCVVVFLCTCLKCDLNGGGVKHLQSPLKHHSQYGWDFLQIHFRILSFEGLLSLSNRVLIKQKLKNWNCLREVQDRLELPSYQKLMGNHISPFVPQGKILKHLSRSPQHRGKRVHIYLSMPQKDGNGQGTLPLMLFIPLSGKVGTETSAVAFSALTDFSCPALGLPLRSTSCLQSFIQGRRIIIFLTCAPGQLVIQSVDSWAHQKDLVFHHCMRLLQCRIFWNSTCPMVRLCEFPP